MGNYASRVCPHMLYILWVSFWMPENLNEDNGFLPTWITNITLGWVALVGWRQCLEPWFLMKWRRCIRPGSSSSGGSSDSSSSSSSCNTIWNNLNILISLDQAEMSTKLSLYYKRQITHQGDPYKIETYKTFRRDHMVLGFEIKCSSAKLANWYGRSAWFLSDGVWHRVIPDALFSKWRSRTCLATLAIGIQRGEQQPLEGELFLDEGEYSVCTCLTSFEHAGTIGLGKPALSSSTNGSTFHPLQYRTWWHQAGEAKVAKF